MILINMGHPLTAENLAALETLLGRRMERVIEVEACVDLEQALAPQVRALAEAVGLSHLEWQTEPILLAPPALNVVAAAMMAELHGRMGYFCPIVRLKREPGVLPPHFVVAEVLDLQALRDEARTAR